MRFLFLPAPGAPTVALVTHTLHGVPSAPFLSEGRSLHPPSPRVLRMPWDTLAVGVSFRWKKQAGILATDSCRRASSENASLWNSMNSER